MLNELCQGKKVEINREIRSILRKILEKISEKAKIPETKERIRKIVPSSDLEEIKRRREKIRETLREISKYDPEELARALENLPKVVSRIEKLDDRILLVENEEELKKAEELGVCDVFLEEAPEAPLLLSTYPTEIGGREPFIVEISPYSLAPDKLVEKILRDNLGERYLKLLREFPSLFSYDGPDLEEVLQRCREIWESTEKKRKLLKSLEEILDRSLEDLNSRIKKRLEEIEIRIKGTDLLELYRGFLEGVHPLSEGIRELQEIIEEEVEEENSRLSDLFEIPVDLFKKTYPVEISEEGKDALEEALNRDLKERTFELSEKIGKTVYMAIKSLERVYEQALWVDFCLSLHKCLKDLGYTFPEEFSGGLGFIKAKNLFIKDPQPVSYFLGKLPPEVEMNGKESKVSILTGANSGGKSTLLETFATVQLMSQMGLPVPAEKAWFEPLECIKMFRTKRRIEGAGALESVLKFLVSLIMDKKKKLILIDELVESVTEPGAAAKILGKILKMMLKTNSYCVVVSHLGEELLREVPEIRVDGIEASGLSEDLSLIVDRQPKFGKIGKSTPELIVERLYLKGKGREKQIFGEILKAFRE